MWFGSKPTANWKPAIVGGQIDDLVRLLAQAAVVDEGIDRLSVARNDGGKIAPPAAVVEAFKGAGLEQNNRAVFLTEADLTKLGQTEVAIGLMHEQRLGAGALAAVDADFGGGTIVQAIRGYAVKAREEAEVTQEVVGRGLYAGAGVVIQRRTFDAGIPVHAAVQPNRHRAGSGSLSLGGGHQAHRRADRGDSRQ